MNAYDSSLYEDYLTMSGLKRSSNLYDADLVIVNTCAVREKSTAKAFSFLGKVKKLKEKKRDLIICFAGCMSPIYEKELNNDRFIDLVLGPLNSNSAPTKFKELVNKIKSRGELELQYRQFLSQYITVIFGCNSFCSYCIVPYVRGNERSVPLGEIIMQIKEWTQKGTKEIILLGQNVNHYGFDLPDDINFAKLLRKVSSIEEVKKIGFMTSHPKEFDSEIIDIIKEKGKIYRHFHLPLQSGDDRILKLMNRGYTVSEYLGLIKRIRDNFPLASITTDIIIGFPGEDEKAFFNTVELIKEVKFDTVYFASFSPRPYTKASKMPEEIDSSEKNRRLNFILEIQREISDSKIKRFIGTEEEVFVTEKISDDTFLGKNLEEKTVEFKSDRDLKPGDIAKVKVLNHRKAELIGKDIQ
jgi:tRNA-2-methylthio-N6-dimethylallyladenosine synthase